MNRLAETVEAGVNLPWSEIMSMKSKGFETLVLLVPERRTLSINFEIVPTSAVGGNLGGYTN